MDELSNTRIKAVAPVTTPAELKQRFPLSRAAAETVAWGRQECVDIMNGDSHRMLAVVGPCSIHDPESAIEYADALAELRIRYADKLCIIMRCYFEKPRTTTGWKGLWSTPSIVGPSDHNLGQQLCREILLKVNERGLPVATEILDPATPQVIDDLIAWGAIGARTTESQTHREIASGLSFPVGIKNGTGGSVDIAINAMEAAASPHSIVGVNPIDNTRSVFHTTGNPDSHLILRGGTNGPNYSREHVAGAVSKLQAKVLSARIMVDCSHANAGGDYRNQAIVLREVIKERKVGDYPVTGVMIESHLKAGKQAPAPLEELTYGQSITDACVDIKQTKQMLDELYQHL
jgi:3-deoxy-7-phosphoheptulonate synthase